MTQFFLIFSNLIIPLISGLFLFFYFVYFVFAHPSKALSFRLLVVFLIAFSAFLFGRPLQLLIAPHPFPLIIVNIRVFILCSVLAPLLILTVRSFNRTVPVAEFLLVFGACLPLGIAYAAFNTLGTTGSYVLFNIAGITAYENLTPSGIGPWYGREVTIAVQTFTGVILLVFSIVRFAQAGRGSRKGSLLADKAALINAGLFIFALSFILGSLARQWWVYYASSVITTLLIGGSVLIDIKELHTYYEKLVPHIKEEIMSNVSFGDGSQTKLPEIFECLGKKRDLNTFILIRARSDEPEKSAPMESLIAEVSRWIESAVGEEKALILPMENDAIGLILRLDRLSDTGHSAYILGSLDELRERIVASSKRTPFIGMGRTYDGFAGLHLSWHEAARALEYAEAHGECGTVHVENISEDARRVLPFPIKEKESILAAIRAGNPEGTIDALSAFYPPFRRYVRERPDVLRSRLNELVCSFVDSAILGGGDETHLTELMVRYVGELPHLNDSGAAERWLEKIVRELVGDVGRVHERRSRTIIENAKRYIEANCRSQIGYRDVAREVFISPSYFLSLFKKETGTTYVDYLTSVRIEKAKRLLVETDKTITEIAFDLGFNNANYFSNIFRKATGISATEYRKPEKSGTPENPSVQSPRA